MHIYTYKLAQNVEERDLVVWHSRILLNWLKLWRLYIATELHLLRGVVDFLVKLRLLRLMLLLGIHIFALIILDQARNRENQYKQKCTRHKERKLEAASLVKD